jgi:hypothetical protein
MGVNTKYKDSVFSFLFSDPDILRELYCALEGDTLPKDVPVTINTLRYKDSYNSDYFSRSDKREIARDAARLNESEYRGYLGTPSGKFREYNPSTRKDIVF